jgi:hypothetical protein
LAAAVYMKEAEKTSAKRKKEKELYLKVIWDKLYVIKTTFLNKKTRQYNDETFIMSYTIGRIISKKQKYIFFKYLWSCRQ